MTGGDVGLLRQNRQRRFVMVVDRGLDRPARHRSRRFVVVTLMAVCCLAIFFGLDFLYSRMSRSAPAIARMAHPVFHHTFRPNFDGYEAWGITLMAVCCLAIFFGLDFLYSRMSRSAPAIARMAHPVFHHTFRPNFDGYEAWGDRQYRLITNMGRTRHRCRDSSGTASDRRAVCRRGVRQPFLIT